MLTLDQLTAQWTASVRLTESGISGDGPRETSLRRVIHAASALIERMRDQVDNLECNNKWYQRQLTEANAVIEDQQAMLQLLDLGLLVFDQPAPAPANDADVADVAAVTLNPGVSII